MNAYRTSVPIGLLIALSGFFLQAGAQSVDIPQPGQTPFAAYDKDGDGMISEEEFNAMRPETMPAGQGAAAGMGRGMGRNMPAFSDYDLNGDGKLEEREFYEARNKRISERVQQGYQMRNLGNAPAFADIDTNGDGAITPEEFAAHQLQHRQQRTP